ncbi:type II secretion system F family protein [Ostreibacterium oceani]|uniref:Type II secretion system protein GspF domain-containing protein n=1 Tax=Ostreibacterium oceani TaxID=2654998 RepID=A0A6N7ES39_9GAMM|nr:type II secretion system F family protein [Ostreibacterium oceani]MPV85312.1 hypothetical protein [Ostreibacterium oceani]
MALFRYQAINETGKTISGKINAENALAAKKKLSQSDLTVFEITELKSSRHKTRITLATAEKALFIRQLATLLGAGYTLEKALQSCARQSQSAKIQTLSQALYARVSEGIPFYRALGEYPKIFDKTFCATVSAGEESGHFATILERLADYAEGANQLKDSVKQALIYPIILFVVATLMIAYLLINVVPDVVNVFNRSGQSLPLMTNALLALSELIRQYGLIFFGALVVLIFLVKRYVNKADNQRAWHALWLKLPLLSPIIKSYHAANYSLTLSMLLNAGVRLVDALKIANQSLANAAMKAVADNAYQEVQKGKSLAQSLMTEKHVFPGMLIELIDSGERSARLAEMLGKAGQIYQHQSQSRIKTLTALLAPVMILIMGGLIFLIVLAILLPIFDLNETINR